MKVNKKILIDVAVILLVSTVITASYYGFKYYKKVKSEKEKKKREEENKEIKSEVIKKYNDIKSFDDFYDAVNFVEYPVLFGYDLKQLKGNIPNLSDIITIDELNKIYNASRVGLGNLKKEESDYVFNLLNKIHSD